MGGPVQPRVPLKDPVALTEGDAGALVLDGQDRLGAVTADRQPDRRSRRGVGGGVVEQVAEDPADGQWVDPDQQRPSSVDGDPMVGVG